MVCFPINSDAMHDGLSGAIFFFCLQKLLEEKLWTVKREIGKGECEKREKSEK